VALLAGGGIRAAADVEALAPARCDGALVATALHDGTITAADLARWTSAVTEPPEPLNLEP
jgi:phosphoribosylformimino-5-aminoimidazole carboxamide ribotide isomerase